MTPRRLFPSFLLAFSLLACGVPAIAQDGGGAGQLPDAAKKAYKPGVDYDDIFDDPEKFVGQKLKMLGNFLSAQESLPAPFDEMLPKSYLLVKLTKYRNGLPYVYLSSGAALKGKLGDTEVGKLITIYATVKKKVFRNPGNGGKNENCYYMGVDDIDQGIAIKEDCKDFDAAKFERVDPKELAIRRAKYLDKPVKFDSSYRSLQNGVPGQIEKLTDVTGQEYFSLNIAHGFLEPVLVARDNEKAVAPIVKSADGGPLTLCGYYRKVEISNKKGGETHYYFFLHGVETPK